MITKITTAITNATVLNWYIKRTILNVFWGLLNISILIFITSIIIGTGWEIIWFIFTLLYGSIYWLLATILFDAIIGNEFDETDI